MRREEECTVASQDQAIIGAARLQFGPFLSVALEGQVDVRNGPQLHHVM
jgi:hypothetical protein